MAIEDELGRYWEEQDNGTARPQNVGLHLRFGNGRIEPKHGVVARQEGNICPVLQRADPDAVEDLSKSLKKVRHRVDRSVRVNRYFDMVEDILVSFGFWWQLAGRIELVQQRLNHLGI